jgi:tRNA(Ile)-lysidine synthetase-like protein
MSVKQSTTKKLSNLLQLLQGIGPLERSRRTPEGRWLAAFYAHTRRFALDHGLLEQKDVVVSVSGGADSVALLAFAWLLWQRGELRRVRALHINHGTRQACTSEQALVESLCHRLGIELEIHHLTMQFGANFEAQARAGRKACWQKSKRAGEVLWQGHHCDDSFEWWLMHALKSSREVLGIQVKHGDLRRPWMAASRAQLRHWCRLLKLDYADDESNNDLRFERNALRASMGPVLSNYAAALHHYCARQNQRASELGVHAAAKAPYPHVGQFVDGAGCYVFYTLDGSNHFEAAHTLIRDTLCSLMNARQVGRASIARSLNQAFAAAKEGKLGPISFKGGVRLYLAPGRLALVSPQAQERIRLWDEGGHCRANIFPFMHPLDDKSEQKGRRQVYPLWPQTTQVWRKGQNGWSYLSLLASGQPPFQS